jgi:hypothetical protein
MLDRSGKGDDEDRLARRRREEYEARRPKSREPEQRAMAQNLPSWDLEPPATILRRPDR